MEHCLKQSIQENYTELCTLEVDISQLPASVRNRPSEEGTYYYHVHYDIVLLFGLTELEAMVAWKENVGPVLLHCIHSY
jgi:hypothetical protein